MDIDQKLDKFLESMVELRKSQAETSKQIKETSEQMKKSDEKLERMGERLGNMGIATGLVAEEFFFRSLEANRRLGNISFDSIERRQRPVKGGTDYDIVLKNGNCVGLIEVKYNAHPEKVKEVKEKKIKQFRGHFPEFPDYQLYFGLASMLTSDDLVKSAKEEGIFLLTQKGEHLEVVNQEVRAF